MVSCAGSQTFKKNYKGKEERKLHLSENYGSNYEGRILPTFLL